MSLLARRRPGHLLVALIYIGLGLVVIANFAADPNERVSGHLANDNTWFAWLLSHGEYSLRHLTNPLFSVRQNYPVGVNMMANTSVLGVTLPLAPVTMLFGPWVTYLIWIAGACAGSAFAAYWVLQRHVVRSRTAAFLGGAAAGFAPGVVHHANGQPNFVSNFLLPFIVAGALRLGLGPRPVRDGIVLGLLVTYQVFLNEEMLLVTAFACFVALLAYAALSPRSFRPRAGRFALALVTAGAVAGVLCAYPLWFQFNGPGAFKSLPLYQTWGEDPFAYVKFARDTVFGNPNVEHGFVHSEQNSWFGWPLTALAVVAIALLWRRSVFARVAAVVVLMCGLLSLGPHLRLNGTLTDIPGPWHFIPDDLPLLGMLTPSRITFAVTGAVALLVALSWDALTSPPAHPATDPATDPAADPATDSAADRAADPPPGSPPPGNRTAVDPPPHGPPPSGRTVPGRTVRGRIAAGAGLVLIAAAMVPLIPKPLPAVDRLRPPVFITSGAWRPYVPQGRALIPVPPPSRGKWGLDALGWGAEELDLHLPEGYFLGPGADGYGHPGVDPPSTLTALVARTYWSGRTAEPTPAQRAAVDADIRSWHGSVIVLRAEPTTDETMKRLLEDLFGPARRTSDVWLWPVPQPPA